jgi:hypothetical protein
VDKINHNDWSDCIPEIRSTGLEHYPLFVFYGLSPIFSHSFTYNQISFALTFLVAFALSYLLKRRQQLNHSKIRPTTQRLGKTTSLPRLISWVNSPPQAAALRVV